MPENMLATDSTGDPRFQIGGNFPPLAEQLRDELATPTLKRDELIKLAGESIIIDDESAGKVTNLSQIMRDFEEELDRARNDRLAPLNDAIRVINAAYGAIRAPVARARLGDDATKSPGLKGMIAAWKKKCDDDAAAERQRLAAEQAEREADAAAAAAAVEEKRLAGTATTADRLEALHLEDEAKAAAGRVTAIRSEPIRATLGQVGTSRSVAFDIIDLRRLLAWMAKQTMKSNLEIEVRKIMGGYLRNLGVKAVERGIDPPIPGIKAWVVEDIRIRR